MDITKSFGSAYTSFEIIVDFGRLPVRAVYISLVRCFYSVSRNQTVHKQRVIYDIGTEKLHKRFIGRLGNQRVYI